MMSFIKYEISKYVSQNYQPFTEEKNEDYFLFKNNIKSFIGNNILENTKYASLTSIWVNKYKIKQRLYEGCNIFEPI